MNIFSQKNNFRKFHFSLPLKFKRYLISKVHQSSKNSKNLLLRLVALYIISSNGVPIKATYDFDPVNLPVQLHLVTLHHFLYGFTHIAQTYINTSLPDTYVGMGAHVRVRETSIPASLIPMWVWGYMSGYSYSTQKVRSKFRGPGDEAILYILE